MLKVARIHTIPASFSHILDQVNYLEKNNISIDFISSSDAVYEQKIFEVTSKKIIPLYIPREINIKNDLKALVKLYIILRKNKYDIVHSSTPKAGLLVGIAGFFARVPVRIHTFTGQRWVFMRGIKRFFFKFLDWFIIQLNHQCYTDAPSQTSYLAKELNIKSKKLSDLGFGSYGGINRNRFPVFTEEEKTKFKAKLNISTKDKILLFLGRVNNDKGINELVEAFYELIQIKDNVVLLIVGPYEESLDSLPIETKIKIEQSSKIRRIGFTNNPAEFYAIADINLLPSYREGFGTVVLEAALYKVPTIGTNIVGLIDAIINKTTGLLIPIKDSKALKNSILELLNDQNLLNRLGNNSYLRVIEKFDFELISNQLLNEYRRLHTLYLKI
jgi:glycosyltransferase involved in cell wall biosynthesis